MGNDYLLSKEGLLRIAEAVRKELNGKGLSGFGVTVTLHHKDRTTTGHSISERLEDE